MSENKQPAKRSPEVKFIPVCASVVAVSDTRTLENDKSGLEIEKRLLAAGHRVFDRKVVTDNRDRVRDVFAADIANSKVDVIIATGGTGVTPRDVTPEALEPLITKHIPGFGELFRWISFEEIGTSTIQSRAMGALCNETYVFLLPGSTGAVRTAMDKILIPQLDIRHRPCNFAELFPRIRTEREDAK